jgi:hypothetical protein
MLQPAVATAVPGHSAKATNADAISAAKTQALPRAGTTVLKAGAVPATQTKVRTKAGLTVWGEADDKPLLKTAGDYVNFMSKGVAMEASESARYDGDVVGRVCATYGPRDLEWIARVPDESRKYIWAISGSAILQMAGLSALEVLLKAGFDPIHINHALERGATFNMIGESSYMFSMRQVP